MTIANSYRQILRTALALAAAGLVWVVGSGVFAPQTAQAAINQQINFQGRLLSPAGAVVADGNYNMEFQIWQGGNGCVSGCTSANANTNNGGTLKWTEDWIFGSGSPDNRVAVKNGYFSVSLGSLTSLSAVDFTQSTLWLSMNVGDTSNQAAFATSGGYLIPFKRLSSSVYAFQASNSDSLGGVAAANYLQFGSGNLQADASTNNSINFNKTSSGNLIRIQSSGSDAFIVDNSGNLQFGANGNHTITVATNGSNAAGKTLTIQAGSAGAGATGFAGGTLTLQGGNAAGTTGNANGGDVMLYGGTAVNSGTAGNVVLAYNGASAVGGVGIGKTPTSGVALDVNGSAAISSTLTVTSAVAANGGLSATKTLSINSGTTQNVTSITYTSPADTGGTNVSQGLNITPTIGNATAGANTANIFNIGAVTGDAQVTLNAVNIGNLTGTAATETALNVGSGWDNVLTVNGNGILGTTGVVSPFAVTGTAAYVQGDLLYASSTSALSRLADVATGSCLVSGGVGANPSWGACGTGVSLQSAYSGSGAGTAAIALTNNATNGISITNASGNTSATGAMLSLTNSCSSCSGDGLDISNAGTGNLLKVTDSTTTAADVLTIADGGATTFKSQTNSTSAFQIQNAAGNAYLTADSTNQIVTSKDLNVGTAGSAGAAGRLFSDNFESGSLDLWQTVTQGGSSTAGAGTTYGVRNGKYAGQFHIVSPNAAYASTPIAPNSLVDFRGYVFVSAQTSGNLDILSATDGGANFFTIYRDSATGKLSLNDRGTTNLGSTVMSTGAWHEVEADINVNGASGTIALYLDGNAVISTTTQNTGSTNPTTFIAGETGTANTSNFAVDDISVDTVRPGDAASLNVNDSFHVAGTSSFGSNVLIQPASNGPYVFDVENTSGQSVLHVDTNIKEVYVGDNTTTTSPANLYLDDLSNNSGGNALLNGNWISSNGWGIGPNSNANDSALRVGATLTAGSITWNNSQNLNLVVTGTQKVQPTTGNDSATAFQVQNAGGTAFLKADSTLDVVSTQDLSIGSGTFNGTASKLFADGFETDADDMWVATSGVATSGKGGTTADVAINNSRVHTGHFSETITTSANSAYEQTNFAAQSTVYARTYFYVTTLGNPTFLMDLGPNAVTGANHVVMKLGASGNLCYTYNGGADQCSATAPSTAAWHKLEAKYVAGSGANGVLQYWLDNVSIATISTGAWTSSISNFALGSNTTSTATVSFDDVAVDTVANGDSASAFVQDALHASGTASFGDSVLASSVNGFGLKGQSTNNLGLQGFSANSTGVQGFSTNAIGIQGISNAYISGYFQSNSSGNTNPTLVSEAQGAATADLFQAQNSSGVPLFRVGSTGATAVQTTSTTAFQVQTASGASTLFTADTSGMQVTVNSTSVPLVLNETNTTGEDGIWFNKQGTVNGEIGISNTAGQITGNSAAGDMNVKSVNGNVWIAAGGVNAQVEVTTGSLVVGKGNSGETSGTAAKDLVLDSSDTAPTAVNGGMYYSTTDNTFECGVNGTWTSCGNGVLLALNGSTPTVGTATAYTTFTGASFTPPAGDCQAGVTYLITAGGYSNSGSNGASIAMDFALYNNGTDLEDEHNENTLLSTADANNHQWYFNMTVTCQGSNNVMIAGFANADRAGSNAGFDSPAGNARTGNIAITDNTQWVIKGRWRSAPGGTGATITMTTCIIQRLAP